MEESKEKRFSCAYHSCAGDFCCYNSWTEPCVYPKCVCEDKTFGRRYIEKKKKELHNYRYERTWCDYLTPCPHKEDVMIGSYECENCAYYKSSIENKFKDYEPCDYGKYTETVSGIVTCSYNKEEIKQA